MTGSAQLQTGEVIAVLAIIGLVAPVVGGAHTIDYVNALGGPSASLENPPGMTAGAMAYDPVDNYSVLFGGVISKGGLDVNTNQTWVFSHDSWYLLHPRQSPPITNSADLTFDALDRYLLFYGVYGAATGQTWAFSHGEWTNLTGNVTQPRVVGLSAMAYDAVDGYVVLYGIDYHDYAMGQTWTFRAGQWSNDTNAGSPPAEGQTLLQWDPTLQALVLVLGGVGSTVVYQNRPSCNATWSFRAGLWSDTRIPSPCFQSGGGEVMVYDSRDGMMVLFFGGADVGYYDGSPANATWLFNGSAWRMTQPSPTPDLALNPFAASTFDNGSNEVLLYGGILAGYVAGGPSQSDQTWAYAGGNWTHLPRTVGSSSGVPSDLGLPLWAIGAVGAIGATVAVTVIYIRTRRKGREPRSSPL